MVIGVVEVARRERDVAVPRHLAHGLLPLQLHFLVVRAEVRPCNMQRDS